jgi:Uma2 family endonuclease
MRRIAPDAITFVAPIDVILTDSEIVEVISPTRLDLDRDVKRRRYAAHDVARCWLVDPVARTVECLRLVAGRYETAAAGANDGWLEVPDASGIRLGRLELWL